MKPKPLSSLNHLTVPVAMRSSTACVLRTRRRPLATTCGHSHYFAGPSTRPNESDRSSSSAREGGNAGVPLSYPGPSWEDALSSLQSIELATQQTSSWSCVISVSGELDRLSAPSLRELVNEQIADEEIRQLI